MKLSYEPVAIIGIGCRFPMAAGPEALWSNLVNGVDAIVEIPPSRFPVDALYDPRPSIPGRITTRWGGFLDDIELFDPGFFGISPREAAWVDPQQRLLLETTWEALESAGQAPGRLRGTDTAVYVGMWLNEYETRMFRDPALIDFYMTTGTGRYSASGRLSHFLGWQGPSVTIDCACSSSLVALHLACRSLRDGESGLAVAGGANVLLEPAITLAYSQSRMMAPDGRCKFGDARANGYVRSEGAAVVVLKLLSRALADGDPIEALIIGSAVNNDGGSGGSFGTPGRQGQEDLLRKACRDAGVSPSDVDFVEAHGTGTRAGDPVEIGALAAVMGGDRPSDRPLLVGSIKTNIGHTEGAAGIAGVIKAALALKHRTIPRNLHFETPNPDIPWEGLPVDVPRETRPWPSKGRPGVAGVSSFGIAGTNAHIVLRGYESRDAAEVAVKPAPPRHEPVVLSAHTPEALRALATRWEEWLGGEEHVPALADLAATSALRRDHQDHRLAIVADGRNALLERLRAFLGGEPSRGVASGERNPQGAPKIVFVCPGQGSQWLGMGRQLYEGEPVFRDTIARCDAAIRKEAGWSLIDALHAGAGAGWLDDIAVIQPALFAVEVALADLWRSWGIEPAAVVGHSMGEVAAACIAGGLDLVSAVRVICRRSLLMKRVSGRGAMALAELTMDEAHAAVAGYEGRVSVAVSNSVRSTVLSGDPQAIDEILARLEAREVFCRRVKVDVASHSPQMDPIRTELVSTLSGLAAVDTRIPMVSTVTGGFVRGQELDANYWGRNVREPVLFASAVDLLARDGCRVFLELSPHPILGASIQQQLGGTGQTGSAWPSLKREEDERFALLETLGGLYSIGCEPDWRRIYPGKQAVASLPPYPWQRERHWYDGPPVPAGGHAVEEGRAGPATGGDPESPGEEKVAVPTSYRVTWNPVDAKDQGNRRGSKGKWLVFSDQRGIGAALTAELSRRGERFVRVGRGGAFSCEGNDEYHISPGRREDVDRLLAETRNESCPDWNGVVYLWGLDAPLPADGTGGSEGHYAEGTESLLALVKSLAGGADSALPRLWIVTAGAQAAVGSDRVSHPFSSMLWGFGRVVGNEHPLLRCTMVDLPDVPGDAEAGALASALVDAGSENQMAIRGSQRYVPRLVRPASEVRQKPADAADRVKATGRAFRAEVMAPGSVEGVTLVPAVRRAPGEREVEVEIVASGLNFLNALSALGLCPGFGRGVGPLGGDCAGLVTRIGEGVSEFRKGDEVFGVAFDSMASHAVTDAGLLLQKPARVGFEEAATVPIAFVTAWYALHHLARIRPGERILIHAAAGGVGQAAVQVARLAGAEVYATAGNPEKKAWLEAQGVRFVSDSRSTAFAGEILAATGGRGVDVVLNSLTGPAVECGLELLSPCGRFVELAKRDIHAGAVLPLAPFRKNIAYHSVDLLCVAAERPELLAALIREVGALLASGEIHPLRHETFGVGNLTEALRTMTESRHIGKLIVSMEGDRPLEPGAFVDGRLPEGTYLVTGGLGGLGLLTARWLVANGARSLVLVGRGAPSPAAEDAIRELVLAGADVRTRRADVADRQAVSALLSEIEGTGPPLTGVVHAAGILDDCTLLEMTPESFRRVTASKVEGAWNLHELTFPRPLSIFVMYSSIAPLFGLHGQANYAAGNAFLDALAQHRRRRGLAGISIGWGPWAHVGLAAASGNRGARLEGRGLRSLEPAEGLARLEAILREGPSYAAAFEADWPRFREAYPEVSGWPMFKEMVAGPRGAMSEDGPGGLREAVLQVEVGRPRVFFLESSIQAMVARVLRQTPSRIDLGKPFRSQGLDSLMGLEVRNLLERGLGVAVPATLIWNYPTVSALAAEVARRAGIPLEDGGQSGAVGAAPVNAAPGKVSGGAEQEELQAILEDLERMSEGEARQALHGGKGTAESE